MRSVNVTCLKAVDASSDAYSEKIDASLLVCASVQVKLTGSAAGKVYLQASNDKEVGEEPVNWTNITNAVDVTTTGSFMIPKTDLSYSWVRVFFDPTGSDAGTITAKFKGIGF